MERRGQVPAPPACHPLSFLPPWLFQGWAGRANGNSRYSPFVTPVSRVLCIGTSGQARKVSLSEPC